MLDADFRQQIDKICAGSEEAIWEFIEKYGPHIERVVNRRLQKENRQNVVQMVWASFFADIKRIAALKNPEELILYLVNIARNKVIDETRRRMIYERYNGESRTRDLS